VRERVAMSAFCLFVEEQTLEAGWIQTNRSSPYLPAPLCDDGAALHKAVVDPDVWKKTYYPVLRLQSWSVRCLVGWDTGVAFLCLVPSLPYSGNQGREASRFTCSALFRRTWQIRTSMLPYQDLTAYVINSVRFHP
jgi:hypothetical protein